MLSLSLRLMPATVERLRSLSIRVVVIGPSGWLGKAAVAMLDQAFPVDELRERVLLFGSYARSIASPSGVELHCFDCESLADHDLTDSVVLHFGYLTKDKTSLMTVDEYVHANDAIQYCVLRAIDRSPPLGLFFASSGAVYQGSEAGTPAKDDNLYGWMKAKHEAEFNAAAEQTKMTFINGRIFTLAGEFINKTELYALGSFLLDLKEDRAIRINSTQPVLRTYIYVGDVINLALALMLNSGTSLSFDMTGNQAIEIGDLAAMCAVIVGRPDAKIIRPALSLDNPNSMIGDPTVFFRLMASHNIDALPIAKQIAATAAYLGFEGVAHS
jgi:nucleoside-diphosphate-sugar epimerase